jgi:hypothetical protein
MQFVEMGNPSGKTLMLLPGTACVDPAECKMFRKN